MVLKKKDKTVLNTVLVAQKIRNFILKNNLQPGDRLPTHPELCNRLKVGLRQFRESLSILRQQGLIETRQRGGTVVKKPTVDTLNEPIAWQLEEKGYSFDDMVRARAALESVIASEAARFRKAKDLLLMLDALERMETQPTPTKEADKTDLDFHLAVLEATHNPVLSVFGKLIVGQFKHKLQENLHTSVNQHLASKREHRSIYHSIEKGHTDSVRKQMYAHIMNQLDEKR